MVKKIETQTYHRSDMTAMKRGKITIKIKDPMIISPNVTVYSITPPTFRISSIVLHQ